MVKNKYIIAGIVVFVILVSSFSVLAQSTKGPNWETSCEGNICSTLLYSYEKYWYNENNEWEEIDENFFDCSEGNLTKYCTNTYYFDVVADSLGEVSSRVNSKSFNMRLSNFRNTQLSFNPIINGSVLIYEDVIPGYVDLRYQYLPHKLKEEIVIKQPLPNLGNRNFNIIIDTSGNARFGIERSYICDSSGICEYINHEIRGNSVNIEVPVSFLRNPNIEYPVIIDPTITLNESYISWNGYISFDQDIDPPYTRFNNPSFMYMSPNQRADIDWNISVIPDGSVIYNTTLTIKVGSPSFPYNVSINHMEGNNNTYPDTTGDCSDAGNDGNCHFYNDMGNGTEYGKQQVNAKTIYLYYKLPTSGLLDIENQLDDDWFSFGITTDHAASVSISARDHPTASFRPVLEIVYGVSGTDAGDAIEEGINNSLIGPNNPISSNKQIYLLDENGNHYLGTFDRSTIFGNQTWAFDYLLPGESSIGMPSLFSILNVWENRSLSYSEIVNQVETFINNTIY